MRLVADERGDLRRDYGFDIRHGMNCDVNGQNWGLVELLLDAGFQGWCTVEQDCDPTMDVTPMEDSRANREYLESIGFK